jgi:hypothetical protein
MKWKYSCPHCKAVLNPHVKIVLSARRGKTHGLVLLSPRPGNYQFLCDDEFQAKVKEGELITLSCPSCGTNLTSTVSKKLAEINLHQPGRQVMKVQFSRVQGEQATFILNGETVVPYGEDADLYDEVNFFGV